MRRSTRGIMILASLFWWGGHAAGQTADSSLAVSSSEIEREPISPQRKSGHFYDILLPGKRGFQPTILYNGDDRFFAGLAFNSFSPGWHADSTGHRQTAYLRYSINQKAFSTGYQATVNHFAGDWQLHADAAYDWVKWTNFYGLGNETLQATTDADYYRIRSHEAYVGLGFQHRLGRQSRLLFTPFFQRIQLLRNDGRFLALTYPEAKMPAVYEAKNFAGLNAGLLLQRLNDLLLPTKGIVFSGGATYTRNTDASRAFTNYNATLRWYLPFLDGFVWTTENGVATVTGRPEFYQLVSLGGATLRGYRSDRFWGHTAFHNNNEVQYLFDAPARYFKGKLGLTAFADEGRVWLRGEKSQVWHAGYGGGILVAVYNKLYVAAQLGFSQERTGFHFTFRRSL